MDESAEPPLNWSETGERPLFGPEIIQHAEEQVRVIRENLKTAQSCQKSQYDRHHKDMVYQPGEKAYLRVSLLNGAHRFEIKASLLLAILVHSLFSKSMEK